MLIPPNLVRFLSCLLGGLLLYGLVFGFVAKRPQSTGILNQYVNLKLEVARRAPSPKLVLLGASNVRYSYSCKVLSQILDMPCVNTGTNVELALDIMLAEFEPTLNAGDFVYLPLGYEPYAWSQKTLNGLLGSAYLFQYAPGKLLDYGWQKRLNAYFYYDIPYLLRSVAESILPHFGLQRMTGKDRSFGAHTLNEYGDETGHTAELAALYKDNQRPFEWSPPDPNQFDPASGDGGKILYAFLKRSKARGIVVVGGLPTVLDSSPVPNEVIATLKAFYESAGQKFLILDNHSEYPRSCFFDTGYHLHEGCQIEHSHRVAQALRPMISTASGAPQL